MLLRHSVCRKDGKSWGPRGNRETELVQTSVPCFLAPPLLQRHTTVRGLQRSSVVSWVSVADALSDRLGNCTTRAGKTDRKVSPADAGSAIQRGALSAGSRPRLTQISPGGLGEYGQPEITGEGTTPPYRQKTAVELGTKFCELRVGINRALRLAARVIERAPKSKQSVAILLIFR